MTVNWRGANLLKAKMPQERSYYCPSLEGAIMPDGTVYQKDSQK